MLLALILALLAPFRVDAGPYAGAFRVAPGGAVNWYFATTSLLHVRRLPEPETREYLNAYLAHLDPNDGIADVLPQPTGVYAPVASDSEDAYASTFLSLAVRYRAESHDEAWWQAHVSVLSDIAYAKLLTQVKPDGLIRASRTDPTGYLMDNAEDYAGLRAFADVLTQTHAHDAAYVRSFAEPLAEAIHRLYDDRSLAFRWSDNDPLGPPVPYPACTAQLFPQLLHITTSRPASDALHFKHARRYAARCTLSVTQWPHEALLYALYVTQLPAPTLAEQRAVIAARERTPRDDDDLVTVALRDALRTERNPAARARRSSS
jgi:hypothetical protein